MKNYILIFFLFFTLTAVAQSQVSAYDSILAKKLHADKNGLKKYVMVILKTAAGDTVKGAMRDSLFAGHMRNIHRLADEGLLVVAGPTGKNNFSGRGIFVFNVETVEEAERLCKTDPTVKAGVFSPEFIPWYASAALQETTRIHETLVRKK